MPVPVPNHQRLARERKHSNRLRSLHAPPRLLLPTSCPPPSHRDVLLQGLHVAFAQQHLHGLAVAADAREQQLLGVYDVMRGLHLRAAGQGSLLAQLASARASRRAPRAAGRELRARGALWRPAHSNATRRPPFAARPAPGHAHLLDGAPELEQRVADRAHVARAVVEQRNLAVAPSQCPCRGSPARTLRWSHRPAVAAELRRHGAGARMGEGGATRGCTRSLVTRPRTGAARSPLPPSSPCVSEPRQEAS